MYSNSLNCICCTCKMFSRSHSSNTCRSPQIGKGSGFIAQLQCPFPPVSYTVLVTCHHVLPDWDTAERCDVYLDKVDGDGFKISGKDLFQNLIWTTCEVCAKMIHTTLSQTIISIVIILFFLLCISVNVFIIV